MVRPKGCLGGGWSVAARTVLAVLVLSMGMTGCRQEPPKLYELSGVEALKVQFNADAGKPRVVLLLSPT